jgi:hypothetical protein
MVVPTYDTPQVQQAALPTVRQDSIVSPGMLSAGADRQFKQGEQVVAAGSALNAVAVQMQHQDDLRSVQTANATYQEAAQNFVMSARDKRTGAAASGLVDEFDGFHRDTVAKILPTLQSEAQKQAFGVTAARSRLALRHDVGTFQISETRKAADHAYEADVRSAANLGAIALTDDAAGIYRDQLVQKARAYAATKNFTPGSVEEQALLDTALTNFHAQRIQNLVQQDPMAAQAYFEKNKGEIAGSQQAEIGAFAKKATATAAGSVTAAATWDALGPKSSADPVNIFDMETRVRSELKGNDAAIEAGIKSLRERDAAFKSQRIENAHAQEAAVNNLVLSGKFSRSSPEFITLSTSNPQAARGIMDYVENRTVRNEQRAAARESREYTAEARRDAKLHRDTLDVTLQMSNPDVLVGMTRNQVTNLLPKLGSESTQHLLQKWEALTNNRAALSEAKLDEDQFKVFAQRAGLDVTPKSDVDKERLITLRNNVERVIGAEQAAKKKALSREERDVILQQQIDNTVMQHNAWWRDQKVPAIALPADKQGEAYVLAGEKKEKVVLSEIPAVFRVRTTRERQRVGLGTTEAQLAEIWASVRPAPASLYSRAIGAAVEGLGTAWNRGAISPIVPISNAVKEHVVAPAVHAAFEASEVRKKMRRSVDENVAKWQAVYDAQTEEIAAERRRQEGR